MNGDLSCYLEYNLDFITQKCNLVYAGTLI